MLSDLRKALGENALATDRDLVRLDPAVASDIAQFTELLSSGRPDHLRDAITLYEDDLLSGFGFPGTAFTVWLAGERARLRELAISAIERLIGGSEDEIPAAERLLLAQRAVALDPYRETAHRHLLRALALTGHRNEALLHFRELERLLQGDLAVQPEAETRALVGAIRSGAFGSSSSPPAESGQAEGAPASPVVVVAVDRRPAADKPAIAVLPFEAIGEDGSMARLAIGITEDIITDLARFRGLDVIARNSAAVYRDRAIDLRKIGRELNVQYIVEGSIQRQSEKIRVTAQLVDVSTGGILWSDRWDRPAEDVFAIQSEVAAQIAATLGGMGGSAVITAEEMRKAKRRPPASLTAYEQYLLANEGRMLFTRESVALGIEAATKAIALDPTLGRAYVARAWLNYIASHYGAEFETAMQAMEADARRALSLDSHDAEARVTLAHYLTSRGRFQESEAQIRAALQANPANAQVLVVAAAMQATNGRPEEAAELADRVMRLDPWMTAENLNCIKDAYFFAGRFEDVVAVVSRIPEDARGRGARLLLTLSYALLDRASETAKARADLLDHYPAISAELLLNQDWAFARRQEEGLFLKGFRAAGVSLCAFNTDLADILNAKRLPECIKKETATR